MAFSLSVMSDIHISGLPRRRNLGSQSHLPIKRIRSAASSASADFLRCLLVHSQACVVEHSSIARWKPNARQMTVVPLVRVGRHAASCHFSLKRRVSYRAFLQFVCSSAGLTVLKCTRTPVKECTLKLDARVYARTRTRTRTQAHQCTHARAHASANKCPASLSQRAYLRCCCRRSSSARREKGRHERR